MVRCHRLVKLLLVRLGLDWSEESTEADALEHAISPRVEQAIAARLGDPCECPHGHPIPAPDGTLERRGLVQLDEVPARQRVVIREASKEPDRLRCWAALGWSSRPRRQRPVRRRSAPPSGRRHRPCPRSQRTSGPPGRTGTPGGNRELRISSRPFSHPGFFLDAWANLSY